jgi:nicotinamidase-related amidase
LQVKLLPAIPDREAILEQSAKIISAARILDIPVTITEQYPNGLGHTDAQILAVLGDRIPIEKIEFSAFRCDEAVEQIKELNRPQAILAGIEAHVCIQQTALDLLQAGVDVHVLADAVGSRRSKDAQIALNRMASSGATITTTESAAFELMKRAGTDEFKNILPLFK